MESRSVDLFGHLFQCKKETKESAVLVLFFLKCFPESFWVVHILHNFISHVR